MVVLYVLWAVFGRASVPRTLSGFLVLLASRFFVVYGIQQEAQVSSKRYRRTWQILGAAVLLWVLSDGAAAGHYLMEGGRLAAPSIWHWMRSAGSFAFLLGIASFSTLPGERFSRIRTIFDVLTLFLTTATLFWSLLIGPILRVGLFPLIPFLWDSLLALFDLTMILLLFRMALLTGFLPYGRSSFLLMCASFILFFSGDLTAGMLGWDPGLMTGLRESFDAGGNLLLILGLRVRLGESGLAEKVNYSRSTQRRLEFWLPIVLSYLAAGYVLAHWYLSGWPDWIGLGLTAAVVIALVTRQGVVAGQYEMRQYGTLVNTVSDPAFICREDGRIRFMNPAAQELLEAVGEKNVTPRLQDLFLIPGSYDGILASIRDAGWTGLVRAGSSGRTYHLSLQPVREEGSSPKLFAGSAHNLSDLLEREAQLQEALNEVDRARNELEKLNSKLEEKVALRTAELEESVSKLAKLNEELKELDHLKSEFITLVSHELRAPLTNIETGVELALHQLRKKGTPPVETLAMVQVEANRLERFIETILDISALDAGKIHFEVVPLDFVTELEDILDEFSHSNLPGRLIVDVRDELPPVLAESRALRSVLFHLMDNVVKYAPAGEVNVEAERWENGVRITIMDQGPGIPESEHERVFDLFHRLDSSDAQETYGYGLGLSAARRFLQAMSGWIRIENPLQDEGGTAVVLWLPAGEHQDSGSSCSLQDRP